MICVQHSRTGTDSKMTPAGPGNPGISWESQGMYCIPWRSPLNLNLCLDLFIAKHHKWRGKHFHSACSQSVSNRSRHSCCVSWVAVNDSASVCQADGRWRPLIAQPLFLMIPVHYVFLLKYSLY